MHIIAFEHVLYCCVFNANGSALRAAVTTVQWTGKAVSMIGVPGGIQDLYAEYGGSNYNPTTKKYTLDFNDLPASLTYCSEEKEYATVCHRLETQHSIALLPQYPLLYRTPWKTSSIRVLSPLEFPWKAEIVVESPEVLQVCPGDPAISL